MKVKKQHSQTIGQILVMGFKKRPRLAMLVQRGKKLFIESEGVTIEINPKSLYDVVDSVWAAETD